MFRVVARIGSPDMHGAGHGTYSACYYSACYLLNGGFG